MSQQASKLVRVRDFAVSFDFYQNVVRFTVRQCDEVRQIALLSAPGGELLLLAGESAGDLSALLTPVYDQPKPGQSHYFSGGPSFHTYRDLLLPYTQYGVTWRETEWGWELLRMVDPDGYVLSFWGGRQLTDDEILAFYEAAPVRLNQALHGLDQEGLDLSRAPGKWSIREIVLHMVDSDATSLALVKFALAEPGRTFYGNSYDPDVWARGLDYAHRSIGAEVELFTSIRRHMAGLLRHIPGALDRTVTLSTGQTVSVRQRIEPLMGHALHHIDQIIETRTVHNR